MQKYSQRLVADVSEAKEVIPKDLLQHEALILQMTRDLLQHKLLSLKNTKDLLPHKVFSLQMTKGHLPSVGAWVYLPLGGDLHISHFCTAEHECGTLRGCDIQERRICCDTMSADRALFVALGWSNGASASPRPAQAFSTRERPCGAGANCAVKYKPEWRVKYARVKSKVLPSKE